MDNKHNGFKGCAEIQVQLEEIMVLPDYCLSFLSLNGIAIGVLPENHSFILNV